MKKNRFRGQGIEKHKKREGQSSFTTIFTADLGVRESRGIRCARAVYNVEIKV
jgi:hypothetical protein